MKKILATTAILSSLFVVSQFTIAGNHHDKPLDDSAKVSHMLDRMTDHLDLTQAQQDSLRPVLLEKVQKMKALKQEMEQKISSHLTAEQQQKFKEKKGKGCKGKGKKHQGDHH